MLKIIALFLPLFLFAANALIDEESEYLRQHANNPVQWLPWGEEALKKAKKEDKPIFLSIGYSTCHWCHVMEKESFENPQIAELLNTYYIPIKVDKEERPDLDKFYQRVFFIMHHRSGGWPLTIILTPSLKPIFSATYIPPEDGYGAKGMKTILPLIAKEYKRKKALLEKRGEIILALAKKSLEAKFVPVKLDVKLAKKALEAIKKRFDKRYGGFGKSVKFPEASTIELLLDIYLITNDKSALDMATKTLKMMAKGGIYDQIEGAFFRYSTTRDWSMPHFEKMLYTNAELIRVYTKAYTITKNPLFVKVVRETIANIDKRFFKDGLYFSASDADSPTEGAYYIYDYQKTLNYFIKHGLSPQKAKRELAKLGIVPDGNFDSFASNPVFKEKPSSKTIELLQQIRKKRPFPFIDKKIITAWNALYLQAKLQAFIFDERYKREALKSLDRLLEVMDKKRLYHQTFLGKIPTKGGMLEDYAFLIKALVTAYEVSLEEKYLKKAYRLYQEARRLFFKKSWYFSNSDIALPATLEDSYYSSALAMLWHGMLDLALLREDLELYRVLKKDLTQKLVLIETSPADFPTASRLALRIIVGDIVLKAKRKLLLKHLKSIVFLPYPYILVRAEPISGWMACKIDTCFAKASSFDKIVKSLNKKEQIGWGNGQR